MLRYLRPSEDATHPSLRAVFQAGLRCHGANGTRNVRRRRRAGAGTPLPQIEKTCQGAKNLSDGMATPFVLLLTSLTVLGGGAHHRRTNARDVPDTNARKLCSSHLATPSSSWTKLGLPLALRNARPPTSRGAGALIVEQTPRSEPPRMPRLCPCVRRPRRASGTATHV